MHCKSLWIKASAKCKYSIYSWWSIEKSVKKETLKILVINQIEHITTYWVNCLFGCNIYAVLSCILHILANNNKSSRFLVQQCYSQYMNIVGRVFVGWKYAVQNITCVSLFQQSERTGCQEGGIKWLDLCR